MGDICRTSNSGSRGPDNGAFIQCVNHQEPQIHKLWCWDIGRICREVHPTVRVDILAETVKEFVTKYSSKNGGRNQIIGKLSINGSVQFIGLSEIWGNGLTYIPNLLAHIEATWCVSISNDSNQSWGESFTDTTSMTSVPWGPVLLTCCGILSVHELPDVESMKVFFTTGVISVCDVSAIGFAGRGWTGNSPMVRYLNNVSSKIPLLV